MWGVTSRGSEVVLERYFHLLSQQEQYWQVQSRVQWLIKDERNTTFFDRVASCRCQHGFINGIYNHSGVRCSHHNDIATTLLDYYKSLYSTYFMESPKLHVNALNQTYISSLLATYLTNKWIQSLETYRHGRPQALMEFTQLFCFPIYSGGTFKGMTHNLGDCKTTIITLILKHKPVQRVSDWRPIGLCNIVHKILAKVRDEHSVGSNRKNSNFIRFCLFGLSVWFGSIQN